MKYFKNLLHRLLFISLILPLGICLILEICIRFIVEILNWILLGRFSHDFINYNYAYRIMEILKFDKY